MPYNQGKKSCVLAIMQHSSSCKAKSYGNTKIGSSAQDSLFSVIILIFLCSGCYGPQNTISGLVISGSVKKLPKYREKIWGPISGGRKPSTDVYNTFFFQIETTHFANQAGPSAVIYIYIYIVVVDARQNHVLCSSIVCRVQLSFSNFYLISLIADGPHHYHPDCGH